MNINFYQKGNMLFRKILCRETQLTTVINNWAKTLDNKGQVDAFILHYEKVFDTRYLLNRWNNV